MKKTFLLTIAAVFFAFNAHGQKNTPWTNAQKSEAAALSKNTERITFPEEFSTVRLNLESFRQSLHGAPNVTSSKSGIVLSVPNSQGVLERFEVFESTNFTPELQAKFPEIRAYVGKGIDDKLAQIRFSADPNGIQAMIFRTDKRNEFIEPYSADGKIYAVFNSGRSKGKLPFTCSTPDQDLAKGLSEKIQETGRSSSGQLLTFRLALSCNAEYSNYFGATSAAQSALVLAAFNATMTRVNGVFEKDLAIHMNIIANTSDVIFYNGATDPYSSNLDDWNGQLQSTLTRIVGEANYDVGHMFGASGGGGNAGCIGCVCVDGSKGSGITSPADGVPQGDNFDIDYVAHELGHQFGGNHTFSHSVEGSGVNVEPGSGSTIMGYAGITSRDVQAHSDDYFVYATINQIQSNMLGKTCPTKTSFSHGTPVVSLPAQSYTIPTNTPFILTGSAIDPSGDALTYCWEQNDTATTQSGLGSGASAAKTGGPNWRSYPPTASPTRYFPKLSTLLANQNTTQGNEIAVEALSSVARTLNFAFTARDNNIAGGQTASGFVRVNVVTSLAPFAVTFPNTNVNVAGGTNQDVTWNVSGTNAGNVNTPYVDIYLSNDGGTTYPVLLASKVPNDGAETVTIPNDSGLPNRAGVQNRIMVKGHKNVFFDISNVNFQTSEAASTFAIPFSGIEGEQTKTICKGGAPVVYSFPYKTFGGFTGTTNFTVTGQPAGSTVALSSTSLSAAGTITLTVTNTATSAPGIYTLAVTATSGTTTKKLNLYLELLDNNFSAISAVSPANGAQILPNNIVLNWSASSGATSYEVQVATDAGFANISNSATVTTNSYALPQLNNAATYYWRVLPKNEGCQGVFSTAFSFGTTYCGQLQSTNVPLVISASGAPTVNSTLEITAAQSVTIQSFSVNVDITHEYVEDITATLISPSGTQFRLFAAQCGSGQNVNATFDDAGATLVCGSVPAISGKVKPIQTFAPLNGTSSQGTWTLRVSDSANQDGGAINSWSLNICSAQPSLSVKTNVLSDLAIYPNPNSGNFNVKFTSQSASEKVQVAIFDISGRLIFEKDYQHETMFNQNIQLNSVQSGVYLARITDGESKVVKQIVVK